MLVFANTHYWIASLDSLDQWYRPAMAAREKVIQATLVTRDEVLVEVLSAFSGRSAHVRKAAVTAVYRLRRGGKVQVVEQSRASFDGGLILYDHRHDKGYSLVDCISMNTMRQRDITKILTNDRHFAQEGFEVLIA